MFTTLENFLVNLISGSPWDLISSRSPKRCAEESFSFLTSPSF